MKQASLPIEACFIWQRSKLQDRMKPIFLYKSYIIQILSKNIYIDLAIAKHKLYTNLC